MNRPIAASLSANDIGSALAAQLQQQVIEIAQQPAQPPADGIVLRGSRPARHGRADTAAREVHPAIDRELQGAPETPVDLHQPRPAVGVDAKFHHGRAEPVGARQQTLRVVAHQRIHRRALAKHADAPAGRFLAQAAMGEPGDRAVFPYIENTPAPWPGMNSAPARTLPRAGRARDFRRVPQQTAPAIRW
jgi:hypothetical protein